MADGDWRRRAVDNGVSRRIGIQLAALLVGLLSALLLILVSVIYVRTQATLSQSLHDALRTRAQSELHHLTAAGNRPHTIQESPREEQERGDIFLVFLDARLHQLGAGVTPFGAAIPDPDAAAAAVRTRAPVFSTRAVSADQRYLIYSVPALQDGRVLGVVQDGASERSYDQSVDALLHALFFVCVLGLVAAGCITWLVVHRALQPIREALRRQRNFVADAAHELRAPLAILRTAAELGLTPEDEEDQQRAMEQVLVQGNHLARLVDDLSLLARVDSGAVDVERAPLDLARLVVETTTGMELLAQEQGVSLRCSAPDDLRVLGDAGRLRQLLVIMIDNAIKHTPPGGWTAVQLARRGHHADLQVRDSGTGIDPADLPHLFERFYRADRARSGEGAGLGLAIARWIVSAHHGQIRAANTPDGGAVFTVSLPLLQ
jgi:signal transduction histidine kinase